MSFKHLTFRPIDCPIEALLADTLTFGRFDKMGLNIATWLKHIARYRSIGQSV